MGIFNFAKKEEQSATAYILKHKSTAMADAELSIGAIKNDWEALMAKVEAKLANFESDSNNITNEIKRLLDAKGTLQADWDALKVVWTKLADVAPVVTVSGTPVKLSSTVVLPPLSGDVLAAEGSAPLPPKTN